MPGYSERVTEGTERNGVAITPATVAHSKTEAIDLSRARRWLMQVVVPTLSGGATVNVALGWSATSNGTFVTITGATIPAETVGNDVLTVELTTDSVTNFAPTAKWMQGYIHATVASAGNVSAVVTGYQLRFLPGTDQSPMAGYSTIMTGC